MQPRLICGDCRDVLKTLPEASVDSIVTDPPYELGFMGKAWDNTGIAFDPATWRECLRVLKPGGHLLAFAGARMYHRIACAIEDAGFEIRDQIMWVYGSGFPKSLDVSKAIDSAAGVEREIVRQGATVARMIPGADQNKTGSWLKDNGRVYVPTETVPATDAARRWQGWGTALKPAHEPIVVARKPLVGTVAENVLAFGTGAINVDGCRVGEESTRRICTDNDFGLVNDDGWQPKPGNNGSDAGRWPANLIHDGSVEVIARFPDSFARPAKAILAGGVSGSGVKGASAVYGSGREYLAKTGYGDEETSAARFFYTAKADVEDRDQGCDGFVIEQTLFAQGTGLRNNGDGTPRNQTPSRANNHPTVKPTDLMRYLCRLVTPRGGLVLDPFMGSGSTGKAALLERCEFIGIEIEPEYVEIARGRIAWLGEAPAVEGMTPREVVPRAGTQLPLVFA